VNSIQVPEVTAKVTYTVVVKNGLQAIPVGSNFTLTPSVTHTGLVCQNVSGQVVVPGQLTTVSLAAGGNITCSFDVAVSPSHQAAGQIASFTVAAAFSGSAGLYVAPLSTQVVPVASGASLSKPTVSFPLANATAKDFITGECWLYCTQLDGQ
jgi:hypothetical protein